MYKFLAGVAAAAMMTIAGASPASAAPSAAPMLEGGNALAPFSFVKFCIDYPGECPKAAGSPRIRLTSARMGELVSVNRAVNAAIIPTPDTSALRYWKLNVGAGDCNNFAIQKRHELIARGWPAAALALTVATTAWGEGHLVVTVRTDQGDLVLDNLRSSIVSWQRAGYHWIMRQSERNPQYWVDLDGGRAGPAYAAASFDDQPKVAEANDVRDGSEARAAVAAKPALVEAAKVAAVAPKDPKVADAAVALDARMATQVRPASVEALGLAMALVGLERAAQAQAMVARAFDAATTKAAIVAAEAETAKAAFADLAGLVAQARQAAAPFCDDMIAALEPFIGGGRAAQDAHGEMQAWLLRPALDATADGFI